MGLVGYDLSQYPLDEHYEVCRKYMSRLDWDEISENIAKKGTIGVDVSDVISLFLHLELDPDYRLICYMTSEYHGVFGRVAAIKKSDDWQPKCDIGIDFLVLFLDLGFAFGADDQSVILDVQRDILLLKAGQVSLQQVVVALVCYISAELSEGRRVKEAAEGSAEKGFFEFLHLPPGVVGAYILISSGKSKHSNTSCVL